MSAEPIDVVTIVVTHDSTEQLAGCLAALARAAESIRARVLVADAGSTDDPRAICDRFGVPFLPGDNRGLGVAFNRALAHDDARRARWILQLNPDVLLSSGALDGMLAVGDREPQCGILAPRQVDQHGELIYSIGVEPSPAAYWRALKGLPGDWVWDPEPYGRQCHADWVMGACILLRRRMLDQIGGFDERFFLCSEEVDLCRRARTGGWSVLYTPEVTVVHPRPELPLDEHRIRLEEWSRTLYLRKWNGPLRRFAIRLPLAIRLGLIARLEQAGRISERRATVRLKAALRFDRRRYGPAPPGG